MLNSFSCVFVLFFIIRINVENTLAARPNVCKSIFDYSILSRNPDCWYDPNVWSNTPNIITRAGYQVEMHVVTTEDGYILTLFRIPHKKSTGKYQQKPPLLLAHGISISTDNFVDRGPKSIAYYFVDADYDVWLPNFRGNSYSKEHLTKSTDDFEYWNFSFHEIATYDLPAVVDYIRIHTGYDQIFYAGNSMGGSIAFVFLSERPEYNKHIRAMTIISPVIHTNNIRSTASYVVRWFYYPLQVVLEFFSIGKFIPLIEVNRKVIYYVCTTSAFGLRLCQSVIGVLFGFSYNHVEPSDFPVLISLTPSGTSWKCFMHYAQLLNNGGTFRKYDYGLKINQMVYGSNEPPIYDLGKIETPIFVIYSHNDKLSTHEDNQRLHNVLNCNVTIFDVEDKNFNHMDFLYAIDADKMVYEPILNFFKQFEFR